MWNGGADPWVDIEGMTMCEPNDAQCVEGHGIGNGIAKGPYSGHYIH